MKLMCKFNHFHFPMLSDSAISEPISLHSASFKSQCTVVILPFKPSVMYRTSSPSPPHPGHSALHPTPVFRLRGSAFNTSIGNQKYQK